MIPNNDNIFTNFMWFKVDSPYIELFWIIILFYYRHPLYIYCFILFSINRGKWKIIETPFFSNTFAPLRPFLWYPSSLFHHQCKKKVQTIFNETTLFWTFEWPPMMSKHFFLAAFYSQFSYHKKAKRTTAKAQFV